MSGARHWLLLIPFAVLTTAALAVAATAVETARIESELTDRARAALSSADLPADEVTLSGRDATVTTDTPQQAARAETTLADVPGIRTVTATATPR